MATLALSRWRQAHSLLWTRYRGASLSAWLLVACTTTAVIGLLWDGGWHASWGRDTFFIPPHDVLYASVTGIFVISSVILVSAQQLLARADRLGSPSFEVPIGIWVSFFGCLTMFTAAPFDEWYHRTYGVDNGSGLWSPPHFFGMVGALIGCLGILLVLRSERSQTARADARPRGLRHLTANDVLTMVMLSYVALIIGGLSLNFYEIRYWYRFDGTLYPWLAMLFGPAILVFAQRVSRRAGAATVAFMIPALLITVMGAIMTAFGYPIVPSLPVMGLPAAIVLDLLYARFGQGHRWLLAAGPICVLVFYPTEYLWAWFLNGHPWWNVTAALWILPVSMLTSTVTVLLSAWLVDKLESVNYFQRKLA